MKKFLLFLMIIANVLILTSCKDDEKEDQNNQTNDTTDDKDNGTKHEHSFSTYSFDETNHWLECSCGEKEDSEEHTAVENESYEASFCSVCNAVYTESNYYSNIASIGVDPSEPHNAYQVLVYSYYDSDGDGYGDLAGLESKLDYIQDLGCDIIWLSPIMESESYHAYDITSFYKIDPKIGTIDDYLSLVNTAHEMGMKIMLDMPINHTSPNHEWFIEYLAGNSDYNEFYQEYDSTVTYGNTSSMGDKAKFYTDSETGKTYFAAFGPTMPDLNYQSETLISAIYDVFDYWTALGADGYRFDAVKHIFDPNEIPSTANSVDLNNELFQNLGTHLKEINPNIYLLGENYSGQGEVLQYAESFDAEFDFESWHSGLGAVTNQDPWGQGERRKWYDDTVVCCTNELIETNPNWIPTFMTGNHDVTRAASYIGDKVNDDLAALKLYAAMITLRSGIPFIYYGDEIGMYGENKTGRDDKVLDSQVRLPMNFYDTTIDLQTVFYSELDDGSILGENMLKDWGSYASDNPVVEDSIDDPNSLYNTYVELLALRKDYPVISLGTMSQHYDYANKGTIISFEYDGEVLHVAFNFSESELVINDLCLDEDLEIIYSLNGADTDGINLVLPARGVAVFTTGALDEGNATQTEETLEVKYLMLVNGQPINLYYEGKWDIDNSFEQHHAFAVQLKAGDVITFENASNGVVWELKKIDSASTGNMTYIEGKGIVVGVDGKYDVYVKTKWEQDNVYFGPSSH